MTWRHAEASMLSRAHWDRKVWLKRSYWAHPDSNMWRREICLDMLTQPYLRSLQLFQGRMEKHSCSVSIQSIEGAKMSRNWWQPAFYSHLGHLALCPPLHLRRTQSGNLLVQTRKKNKTRKPLLKEQRDRAAFYKENVFESHKILEVGLKDHV